MFGFYFLKLFLVFLTIVVTLYFSGQIIRKICLPKFDCFSNNIFLSILFNIHIAFLLISSLSAVVFTRGQTFQWVILFSIIGIFVFSKTNSNKEIVFEKKLTPINKITRILTISALAVFSFVFVFYINGAPNNLLNIDLYYDLYYYSKLSGKLVEIGLENPNVLLSSYLDIHNSALYHYTDLWFNGFISKYSSLSETEALMFVTYPILVFLTLVGALGVLFEKLYLNIFKILLISIILLYGCSFYLPFENFAIYQQAYFRFQGGPGLYLMLTKTLILFPSLFLAFHALKRESLILFTLWILIAMASYNTVIPVLVGGSIMVFILKFYQVFLKDNIYLKQDLILATFIFILFFMFLGLYMNFFTLKDTTPLNSSPPPLKSIIILFMEYMISPWLVYPLIAFIIFIEIIKKRVDEFQFTLILFLFGGQLAGTLFVIMHHNMNNINQALSNPVPPLILVCTIFFLKTIPKNTFLYIIYVILLTCSSFYNFYLNKNVFHNDENHRNQKYSDDFKKKIYHEINLNHKKAIWVTLNKKQSPYFYYSYTAPGSFIFNMKNADYPIDISPYFSDSTLAFCNINWNSSFPLCKDIIKDPSSSETIINDFLLKKNVSYLFVENQKNIPSILSRRLKLVVKDGFTGDAFYKLKF